MADGITAVKTGVRGPRQFQALFSEAIPFTLTFEDDTIATDSIYSGGALVDVPGAQLGDFVFVAAEIDQVECQFIGAVQAADKVEVTLVNDTSGTVTAFASGVKLNGLVLRLADSLFADPSAE
jgi:hypothetical protein